MQQVITLMNGLGGRAARVLLGAMLIAAGVGGVGGVVGGVVAIIGVVPLAMGIWGRCLVELVAQTA